MAAKKHVLQGDPSHLVGTTGVDDKGKTTDTGKGCIIKCDPSGKAKSHGAYRSNAYNLISGDSERNQFLKSGYLGSGKFPSSWTEKGYGKTLTVHNPDSTPGAFDFTGDSYLTANEPFCNNAHHIMPWSSLKGALDDDQGILLQKSGYNLNAGDNLIFLPCRDDTALFIGCYTHPGAHKPYNDQCATAVQDVVDEIKNLQAKSTPEDCKINEENVKMLRDSLEEWQKLEYKVLVRAGRKVAATNIKHHVPSKIRLVIRSGAGA
jgi:hypothetical protein